MSNNIVPLMTAITLLNKCGRSSYSPEEPKENIDLAVAIVLFLMVSIILFLCGVLIFHSEGEITLIQNKGVGYYATEYSGKYNTFIFLGDTSKISKDSAIKLMVPRKGRWFLEVKDYYDVMEKAEKVEITTNTDSIIKECLGNKFMDYRCETK